MSSRLDLEVSRRFGLSRRAAQDAVRCGRIDVAGQPCDEPGRLVGPDVAIDYLPHRPRTRRVSKPGLNILHEDPHVLIVVKPPGLLTLPTVGREPDTLAGRVKRYLRLRHGGEPYLGIVHRLDRDTSGAIAFALTPEALGRFQDMFCRHDVHRRYVALVWGRVLTASGTIELPIVDLPGVVRRRVARPGEPGQHAVTHFQVIEHYGGRATLLSCQLETGRSHQIRVHMAQAGHAVVGDALYRPKRGVPRVAFKRQALHAQVLGFQHPIDKTTVRVEAPMPPDLLALIDRFRRRA